ncbi:GntR family transcriptional regulator [Thalassospiraceae bacterium LMO-JJ14]|nr:GntR family transcriptional regulator [Thalassospiraceae bacterium LMO-JJ14]
MNDPFHRPAKQPLYVSVRDSVLERIGSGAWAPGDMLPSEFALADEFDVSQGTIRKALDDLAARNLVVRRQGKGTFIAAHTPERALFHFFHIVADDGVRELPTKSHVLSCRRRRADKDETEQLMLDRQDRVVEIRRIREMDGKTAMAETVCVPAEMFPDLDKRAIEEVPNELYQMYEERYGITVHRALERLRAVAASPEDASALGVKAGTPLLEISRIAETLGGRPVEMRKSRCLTDGRHYQSIIV